MRKLLLISALIVLTVLGFNIAQKENINSEKEKFRKLLAETEYKKNRGLTPKEIKKMPKKDRPHLGWQQDFMRTMDPALGRPAKERLATALAYMQSLNAPLSTPGSSASPWVERGPNNVAGRTRGLVWDPNAASGNKVWAGGVTGGLWYNDNITSATSQWASVSGMWDNIAITSIAFDPNNTQTMYVGTGEGFGAGSTRGAGIWKSTDGGTTWNQIASTTAFYYVNDIVVRNESGTSAVYAAVDGGYYNGQWHGTASAGLRRSTNGGTTWTQVLPNIGGQPHVAADIEIAADNKLWIGTKSNPYGDGGGKIYSSTNGTTWTLSNTTSAESADGRVELACAPSNANTVYAAFEDNYSIESIIRTTNGGTSWTDCGLPNDADPGIPASDFTRGQAWYDLILAVDPNNANTAIVGGIDLFRTTNSGTSWSQISVWYNGLGGLNSSYVHADQHAIAFKPGQSNTVIFGTDGGVFYTTSVNTAANNDVISARNLGYNVTQYYSCAISPAAGSHNYLAGSQDNGTQRYNNAGMNATTEVYGGDGGYCFIDQNNANYQIASYVYNNYYRSNNSGTNFNYPLIEDDNTGDFINAADYDDNQNILFTARNSSSIWRIRNVTTTPLAAATVNVSGMSDMASHIRVSPYTTASSTVFVGSESGDLFKVTNANATASVADITGSLPTGSISCVELGANENQLLVTYSNYGLTSVWYSANGGTTWTSKEGNLPDMPVRWALFNPNNYDQVILATELGVWATNNFSAASPNWVPSNNGLANVRVDMLQLRSSDKQVIAATYGRGLFSSEGFAASQVPQAGFAASTVMPCLNQTVTLTDTSFYSPNSWTWSISPATFNFVSGTSATSQNPQIQFTAPGNYTVSLTVGNTAGVNTVTKTNYITAGGFTLPFVENFENPATYSNWEVDNPDNGITWGIYNTAGNLPGTTSAGVDNFTYQAADGTALRDGLISPPINLAGYSSSTLTFDHAYRRYAPNYQDSMAVYVSTNCGTTWTRVATYKETAAATPYQWITSPDIQTAFSPTAAAQWCGGTTGYAACKSINLTPFVGQTIKVKFENISSYGNNLYIDDINITGVQGAINANFSASTTTPCIGSSVSFVDLSAPSATSWAWSITPATFSYTGGTSATSQNPQVIFNAAGNYSVTLTATNPNGNDQEVKTNYIVVNTAVIPSVTISSNNTTICAGQNISFTANATNGGTSPTYQWKVNGNNAGTAASFSSTTLNNGDVVSLTLTSSANCASPAIVNSNSISVTVNPSPTVGLNFVDNQVCINEPGFALSGGTPAGGTYSGSGVSNGNFNPSAAGAGTKVITYSYTDGNGCSGTSTANMIVSPLPAVPTVSLNGNTLTCNLTLVTYQWYKDAVLIPGATQQTYNITQSGNYSVEVINTAGCKNISEPIFASPVSVIEIEGINNMVLYPNPSKGEFKLDIKSSVSKNVNIEILNATGKLIFETKWKLESGNNQIPFDLTKVATGIYILNISDENGKNHIEKINIQ